MHNFLKVIKNTFIIFIITLINPDIAYAMKSLNIDIIVSWEYGIAIFTLGSLLIAWGVRQGKKTIDDINYLPITKPTTKLLFGSFLMIFGLIQLLPLLKLI